MLLTFGGIVYRWIVKPVLFCIPADYVHSFFLVFGRIFGKVGLVRSMFGIILSGKSKSIEQKIEGITFSSPVGLAAGFDYDADLIDILPSIGFGFHTIGTVTYQCYGGNPYPMLGRLPKSQALLVNKGFKSSGIKKVLEKVPDRVNKIPLGISLGQTNRSYDSFEEQVEEVVSVFKEAQKCSTFSYYELNISCPNLVNIKDNDSDCSSSPYPFQTPAGIKKLLDQLVDINLTLPVFVKLPSEIDFDDLESLLDQVSKYKFIKGVISVNLIKDRSNNKLVAKEVSGVGKGNFSGKPTEELSNKQVSFIYNRYKSRFVIVGCGGIFSGADAYLKIKSGASLVQLITGMIYMGPQTIAQINKELNRLLVRDGYKNISEAVGAGV